MNEERFEALLDADFDHLLEVGSRVVELERHFNNQRGFDRGDDTLPYELEGFDEALDRYYQKRGWQSDGTVASPSSGSAAPADD
jgi:aldehyde:ferredoxin oxidoreductase